MNRPLSPLSIEATKIAAHGVDGLQVDELEAINQRSHSLAVLIDDLIKDRNTYPDQVQKNAMLIAGAYGRLQWLQSSLQETERKSQRMEAAE